MGIFDKRTDTEKEISEFYNKPKLIIEIGKENKQNLKLAREMYVLSQL